MKQPVKIVVVEDNRELLDDVVLYLRLTGFDTVGMSDGRSLDRWRAEVGFDILILDINLPGEDGFSIARRLSGDPGLGIIILTARSDVGDRVLALQGGADVYLSKPVDMQELVATIGALWRRLRHSTPVEIQWVLDPLGYWLTSPDGDKIALSPQESLLLSALAQQPDGADRVDIIRALGETPELYDPRRLEALVSRLRRKLKAAGEDGEVLRARRGSGYLFAGRLVRAG
ncbi:MAG: response regulator transcription factor [Azospirillaceae bacterium]|nr:response regulator transcription factor [Azospirillaceae bacterium]